MSRDAYRGPTLPKFLLDKVQNGNDSRFRSQNVGRKDRRKAERQQKKAQRQQPVSARQRFRTKTRDRFEEDSDDLDEVEHPKSLPKTPLTKPAKDAEPLKSILKKEKPPSPVESESEVETEQEEDVAPVVSRTVKAKLEDDDDEIAALEKKLGIKGKKSKALEEDGLDWLAEGSGGEGEGDKRSAKRKRPEDTKWLRDKRVKAGGAAREEDNDSDDDVRDASPGVADADGVEDEIANPFSEDELDSDDFAGFESGGGAPSEGEDTRPPKRQRENPYVAPLSKDAAPVGKYVPPSLRKPAASDEEALKQLRRQMQGLLNRLSEANLLSILQSLEEIYTKNARQHVTSTLIDLLVGRIADPSTLNDTFLILHAGFSAGVYKVIGTDFGAQLLEKTVENIDHFRPQHTEGKQSLNLLAFLCCLYSFQLVGSAILFGYIRLLLDGLSETNTELLLRIIRTCGQQIRQDDPSALKDIVLLLQRSVAEVGEDKLSVRTKFMIETINELKNNRVKTGVAGSVVTAEHTTRMKKTLGSLNNSRSLKATEPLRITLADIRDSEKKGKWWLVGASYHDPVKLADGRDSRSSTTKARHDDLDAGYESETPGSVNLHKLARSQGMNTDVRRAIFIATLSSADFKEAHMRVLKLHLKNKQMLEVPRVLVHCVGAEEAYNPFYALVAGKFCGDHKLRKAFQFALWDALKRMEANDEDEENEGQGVRKTVNMAKFYGALIAEGSLSIAVLKKVEFGFMEANLAMFVEVLTTTVLLQARKAKIHDTGGAESPVKAVFLKAAGAVGIITGLRYVMETTIAKAELASGKKEKKAIEKGCLVAIEALDEARRAAPVADDLEDEEEDF
ncbi:suppressor of glycerol defect [Vermiconidia calcicola]|uniref:Suppressor of glycerol defect n=1 Tax=Vermiconidia calcicola TaxID=1690605 RepID=A0ACC3MNN5_9PEZI|nr:suppressor of glycerol defect [Vermiconidia calcicola]